MYQRLPATERIYLDSYDKARTALEIVDSERLSTVHEYVHIHDLDPILLHCEVDSYNDVTYGLYFHPQGDRAARIMIENGSLEHPITGSTDFDRIRDVVNEFDPKTDQ